MDQPSAYTPDTWLLIACTVLLLALMVYGWRRRAVPGAWYFAAACLYTASWTAAQALWLMTENRAAKAFWDIFATGWQIPAITALFCFIVQYAGLDRWLTRRTLVMLSAPPFLFLVLALTNDRYHLLWTDINYRDYVQPMPGPAGALLVVYGSLLYLACFAVLAWAWQRSPARRRATVLIVAGHLAGGAAFVVDPFINLDRGPLSPLVAGVVLASALYALALFRFRILVPIVEARGLVIEQMREGMLVLDTRQMIVDLNPAAEQIIGRPLAAAKGRPLAEVLPESATLNGALVAPGPAHFNLSLGAGADSREYDLHVSPLQDQAGAALGQLILFRDITAEKAVQARTIEQQRIMATLGERERLARELHDSAGQVLGYVSLQAQAIAKHIHDGDAGRAEALSLRLAEAAQSAHHDIRESILGLKTATVAEGWSFLVAVQQHLEAFSRNYGIEAELRIPPGLSDRDFGQAAGVQALRVIQEALSNARRHGQASTVRVIFEREGDLARIIVADDGCGFDPEQPAPGGGNQYGLAMMHERMAQVAGRITIDSHPGAGTRVIIALPCRQDRAEGS